GRVPGPPPGNRSIYTEDEYRVPPPVNRSNYTEDEYRLPPPARNRDSDEDDYRLPPPVGGNRELSRMKMTIVCRQPQPAASSSSENATADPDASHAGGDPNSSGGVDYMNVKKLSPLSRGLLPPSDSVAFAESCAAAAAGRGCSRRAGAAAAAASPKRTRCLTRAALAASESSSLVESDDDSSSDDNNDEIDGGAVDDSEVTGATVGLPVIDYAQIDISGLHVAALDSGRSDKVADLTNKMNGQVQYLEVDVRRTAALAEMSVKPTL
uniref:IRS-type PTB domain-containing protein n=1 Tax=Macrostomum lignano TaxID=282301 RepID=A0A1I8FR05_9PLAT